ncbi:MAG: metallophosphoesterase [Proteobacteria bacterium]|nr:metallophosphoesterase [Pseudomonadota bacterium]
MQRFKLIQISDCHLPESPDTPYRGKLVWQQLEAIIERVAQWSPDAVVASGDISEQSGPESYAFFQQVLSSLDVPVYCLSGNHDEREAMQAALSEPLCMPTSIAHGNWRLHFLDSASHQRIHGELTPAQLDKLASAVDRQAEGWAMVFLHHQPILCGSHWIDRYPLQDPQPLLDLVDAQPKIRSVCWGHIHHDWRELRAHCLWMACPSTAYTVLPNQESLVKDPRGPACRWIELTDNGEIKTGIFHTGE